MERTPQEELNEQLKAQGYTPLESSNLRAVAFRGPAGEDLSKLDPEVAHHGTLEVMFMNGARWQYRNVPRELFTGITEAESAGRFFASNIKGNKSFESHKVEMAEHEKPASEDAGAGSCSF